ncbi:MAG: prepilin-type N-terminal cleavage/methylation domain-containing protein [bacterium]|nr:prepilin-type N-terminal cleavage/methylation domain-containing protein [bacterium]
MSKGFTLVEVLVAMAIFLIAVILIFSIYLTSQKFYRTTEIKAEILQNARVILERMTRELRQTQDIVTVLPQAPDNPDSPPMSEIEFQDGHSPDYYYIRYYVSTTTGEIIREYKVYCLDVCEACSTYFKWDAPQVYGCSLENRVVGEFAQEMKFWGAGIINVSLKLQKINEEIDFQTNVFSRNF